MNNVQRLQLERVRHGSFNSFDGEQVADSLEYNENLWTSFVFGRFGYLDLIELRDLDKGYLNSDTLMVLTKSENVDTIRELARSWQVDEFGYVLNKDGQISFEGTSPFNNEEDIFMSLGAGLQNNHAIVRLWWD